MFWVIVSCSQILQSITLSSHSRAVGPSENASNQAKQGGGEGGPGRTSDWGDSRVLSRVATRSTARAHHSLLCSVNHHLGGQRAPSRRRRKAQGGGPISCAHQSPRRDAHRSGLHGLHNLRHDFVPTQCRFVIAWIITCASSPSSALAQQRGHQRDLGLVERPVTKMESMSSRGSW